MESVICRYQRTRSFSVFPKFNITCLGRLLEVSRLFVDVRSLHFDANSSTYTVVAVEEQNSVKNLAMTVLGKIFMKN